MPIKTYPFDASRYIDDAESQAELLADALETGHASYLADALGVIARARGMTQIAREAGVTREVLYDALQEAEDQELATLHGIAEELRLRLQATSASEPLEERLKA